ncbi:hypothetical protein OROMI_008499 [Orobanche minor]
MFDLLLHNNANIYVLSCKYIARDWRFIQSAENKLGEGGFGPVYKGTLSDERIVAVKKLSVASNQGKIQFVAEVAAISAVQHLNLVKLYGCCIEGHNELLVYEYLGNKSLDKALFGTISLCYFVWDLHFFSLLNGDKFLIVVFLFFSFIFSVRLSIICLGLIVTT